MASYQVVKRDNNSVSEGLAPVIATCGHKHRTRQAADTCLDKLTASHCLHGVTTGKRCYQCSGWTAKFDSTSLLWRGAAVEQAD